MMKLQQTYFTEHLQVLKIRFISNVLSWFNSQLYKFNWISGFRLSCLNRGRATSFGRDTPFKVHSNRNSWGKKTQTEVDFEF